MHYRAPESLLRQIPPPPLQQQYRSIPGDRSSIESTRVLLGRKKKKTHPLVHKTPSIGFPLLPVSLTHRFS